MTDDRNNIEALKVQRNELQEKLTEIDEQISLLTNEAREKVLKELQQQVILFRFTSTEILGTVKKKENAKKSAKSSSTQPLYRNENGETWTGRGRSPKWINDVRSTGGDIKKYLIAI